jgi:hypothetical protein
MVELRGMWEKIYPYSEENRIKIEDGFMREYYAFTISNRPVAFYMRKRFPVRRENDTLVILKKDNLRFCSEFEEMVRGNIWILERILKDRDEYIEKLNEAIVKRSAESVLKYLLLLGRYGIEWYFPYQFLYEKLKRYFTDEEIDWITSTIKISDELPYFLKIWWGLKEVKEGRISLTEYIENYGFLGRKTLEKCKYEYPEEVSKLLEYENPVDTAILQFKERLAAKQKLMRKLQLEVDEETFTLLRCFAQIDTENELIHNERAKSLKFLSEKGFTVANIMTILKRILKEIEEE